MTVKRFPSDPPKNGFAMAVIDYSQEAHLLWVIAMDDSGEVWCVTNGLVRVRPNPSMKAKRIPYWPYPGEPIAKAET